MNLENVREELERLLALVQGWITAGEIPSIRTRSGPRQDQVALRRTPVRPGATSGAGSRCAPGRRTGCRGRSRGGARGPGAGGHRSGRGDPLRGASRTDSGGFCRRAGPSGARTWDSGDSRLRPRALRAGRGGPDGGDGPLAAFAVRSERDAGTPPGDPSGADVALWR